MGSLAGGLFPYGGKWLIPPGKIDAFWQTVAVAQRDPSNYLCFVYKPLRKDLPSPLMFDIDVKTSKEIPVDKEAFVKLAKVVARAIAAKRTGNVKFCVVCKQTGYFKTLKKENDVVYATGCHLYFTNTVCDVQFAEDIRQTGMRNVPDVLGHLNILNSAHDVFDNKIPSLRSNGLMLVNSFKTKKEISY